MTTFGSLSEYLSKSGEPMRLILEGIPQIVVVLNSKREVEYCNSRFYEYTGKTPQEILGKDLIQAVQVPAKEEIVRKHAWREALEHKKQFEMEYRLRRADGSFHWHLARAVPINLSDKDGEAIFWFGTITDISRLKRAEEDLRQNEIRYRLLVEKNQDGILVVDTDGNIRYANPLARDLLGRDISGLVGESFGFPISTDKPAEIECRRPTGEIIVLELQATPLEWGELNATLVILRDIQQHKRVQSELESAKAEALQSSQLKSSFLANMSHEIRTPINGVIGMTGLLLSTSLDDEQKDYAETIRRSADSLLTVINDILDFSKVEAGKLDIENVDFELGQIIDDVRKTLTLQSHTKGNSLMVEVASGIPTYVKGDPTRLRQILTNLVSNALKFTHQGNVTMRILWDEKSKSKIPLRFEVSDTGTGIPAEALGRMFQAFSQAESSIARRFGGTGLGLSICKQLVELMGGKIGVLSKEGEGSTFWFTLAFEPGEASQVNADAANIDKEFKTSRPIRILLAEDNPVNQKIALKMLEKMGHHADVVANGSEVLDALREIPYDLVLMDCQMPEMDGYEATQIIRTSDTLQMKSIPIIAMTANAMEGDREKCLKVGMDDYVSKPIRTATLGFVIEKWVTQKKI